MAFDNPLADRIRELLGRFPGLYVEEKKMFGGLAFLVNGKMCVNVSQSNLMCRFDPALEETLSKEPGYMPVVMQGRTMKGYAFVSPDGIETPHMLEFWINKCLDFNGAAKSSK